MHGVLSHENQALQPHVPSNSPIDLLTLLHKTPLAHTAVYCRTSQTHESQPQLTGKPGHIRNAANRETGTCTDCHFGCLPRCSLRLNARPTAYGCLPRLHNHTTASGPAAAPHPCHSRALPRPKWGIDGVFMLTLTRDSRRILAPAPRVFPIETRADAH